MEKRFLIISTMNGFGWGGSEELWYAVAKEALSQGYKVEVVVFENLPVNEKLKQLQQLMPVYYIKPQTPVVPSLPVRFINKIIQKPLSVSYKNRFSFLLERTYDFILVSQGGATDIIYYDDLVYYLDQTQTPYFILNHLVTETMFLQNANRSILLNLFSKARQLYFVSSQNIKDFERRLVFSLKDALVVKNPVNLPVKGIVDWPKNAIPQLAMMARLEVNHKGHDLLLDVLRSPTWRKRAYKLNIYGSGPHELYLRELIKFYELQDRVELKGHCGDIRNVWKENEILVSPSRTEGMPLTIVEAMLCGRPVVATCAGDSATVITEGVTGWIAESASLHHIQHAMEKAWESKDRWKEAGEAAFYSIQKYEDPEPGKALLNMIQHVMQ